jgi:peptide chain release factor 1
LLKHHPGGSILNSAAAAAAAAAAEFAREEIAELEGQVGQLETQLKLLLLPKDPLDERDIMLEIR